MTRADASEATDGGDDRTVAGVAKAVAAWAKSTASKALFQKGLVMVIAALVELVVVVFMVDSSTCQWFHQSNKKQLVQ